MEFDPVPFFMTVLVFIVAITIHEFAHAVAADRLGDPLPRSQGRISINPVDHIDPIGLLFMAVSQLTGTGLGWGKPVMTRSDAYKHPRIGMMIVAACGPLSNLLQAVVYAGVIHLNDMRHWYANGSSADGFMQIGVRENVALMFFNFIPIPPLDGAKVLSGLLPEASARAYDRIMNSFGLLLFMLLIVTRATQYLIGPEIESLFHFLADQR